jgi:hypothetical protein
LFAIDEKGEYVTKGTPPDGTLVEELKPVRWVVCVGTYDHRAASASMRPYVGQQSKEKYPTYRRLEVERQERAADGSWSEWKSPDAGPTERILGYITEVESEARLARVSVEPLASWLPHLEKGSWTGTSVTKLELTDEQLNAPRARTRPRNEGGLLVTDEPELLVRFLDFGVEPGKVYRFRCRIVFEDPRSHAPSRSELLGPWSEPTDSVRVKE